MPKQIPAVSDERAVVYVKCDARLKDDFRALCAMNGLSISDGVRALMAQAIERHRHELNALREEVADA
jgi:antitoxin component of RelBE/YafQ-DinJ toxin-antitoxin module